MIRQSIAVCVVILLAMTIGPVAVAQGASSSKPEPDKIPLDKVCVQRSDLYSPGAVSKMGSKNYVCKKDPNDKSGQMRWVEQKPQ